jgi:hypothetical protein
MVDVLKLRLGADVVCQDGNVGVLRRIIFVPESHVVTHLDVAPHAHRDGRLVPIESVEVTDAAIHLACTVQRFSEFASDVDETELPAPALPAVDDEDLIQRPTQFGFGAMSGFGGPGGLFGIGGPVDGPQILESEALPEGEDELERGTGVFATDGHVGHADGLVVSKADHRVTHLLLSEGHVFGVREVAIPVDSFMQSAVQTANLSLSKAEVRALPPV